MIYRSNPLVECMPLYGLRNAKSYTTAKNASVADYRRATGFEALMGYLYLTGQTDRMLELIKNGIRLAGLEI